MKRRTPLGIALVNDSLERGGAERVLVTLAEGLDPARFRVHVVTTRHPGALAGELPPHVRFHSLDRRGRGDFGALYRFASLVERDDIRLIHTHSHTAAYFAGLARFVARGQWSHVFHDHFPLSGEVLRIRLLDRLFLRNVDHYFAVSRPLHRYATERVGVPEVRCEHLCNGIRIAGEPPPARDRGLTIVQLARLEAQKDQQFAMRVAARLRDAGSLGHFRWLMVGRASSAYAEGCRAAARRLCLEDVVAFEGESSDVGRVLREAHIGVLTSREEGLPIALLEYMAAALPVVVTDVGDCGRVVRASSGGAVVAHGDVAGFASALEGLVRDRQAAEAAGAANAAFVRRRFSAEAMVRRVSEVYDELVGEGDRRTASAAA